MDYQNEYTAQLEQESAAQQENEPVQQPSAGGQSSWNSAKTQQPFRRYPDDSKPPRRVGTISLGLSLILIGSLVIYALFNPNFSPLTVAKFAPFLLIVIGLEIILSSLFHREGRVKYDFLSVFICAILIITSLAASVIPVAFRYSVGQEQIEQRLTRSLSDDIYDRTATMPNVVNCEVSVYHLNFYGDDLQSFLHSDLDYEQIRQEELYDSQIYFSLKGDYGDASAFALAVREVLDGLTDVLPANARVHFDYDTAQRHASLAVNGRYQANYSAADLTERVEWYQEPEIENGDGEAAADSDA